VERLTIGDLLLIAEAALDTDATRLARIIDVSSAESALAAPFAGFGVLDFYPDPAMKAAILCSRLLRHHPFPDGNKRVAFLAMLELLGRNGHTWIPPEDNEAAEMIERVAARDLTEDDFVAWVAQHVRRGFTEP
jgi:death on curing protein